MIDLKPFCEQEPMLADKYNLGSPWVAGDFSYATNGKRCARRLANGDSLDVSGRKLPNVTKLFAETPFPEDGWSPLPELPPAGDITIGRRIVKCRTCEGNGTGECDMGHFHSCGVCSGAGSFAVANHFDTEEVRPFWGVAKECSVGECEGSVALFFRGDEGFQGIVMPKVPDGEELISARAK